MHPLSNLTRLWPSLLLFVLVTTLHAGTDPRKPNIILIYADDLGYGDLGCYGAKLIPTPNIDKIAGEGLRFTNGYATSGTCTPSRYALLTGQYPWRIGARILKGDAAMIVKPGTPTLPSLLKDVGYRTGAIGKWHLGIGNGDLDWNKPIYPCPNDVGYDYSFIMAATMDRVPCVYVRNGQVVGLDPTDPLEVSYSKPFPGMPIGRNSPEGIRLKPSHGHNEAIVNGVPRIGYFKGGKAAQWIDEDMADTYTNEAFKFMEENKDRPFFLYLGYSDPHVPRLPNKRFLGTTTLGTRGDSIVEFDWCAGEIMKKLQRLGLDQNTLVIVSSDNGPVLDDGYQDNAKEMLNGHTPWGPLQGGKYSSYEAGTRVPFIVRWPGQIKPGVSEAMVCQIDFAASFAALTGRPLKPEEAPDSWNVLPALLGESTKARDYLVTDASKGGLSIREGNWKLMADGGKKKGKNMKDDNAEKERDKKLFDLSHDLGETTNLADKNPEKVEALLNLLEKVKASQHTRPN